MPRHQYPDEKGDLYVTYQVILPSALSNEQKNAISEIFS
jgi:DnaJ-class molecular chaperone